MNLSHGSPYSRRKFLQVAGAVVGAAYLPSSARAAGTPVNVRQDLATLSASSPAITTLQQGIAAMKALPSSDLWNWNGVANIHQNFCAHNNWYFLPWHRPYVGYFEYIIQNLTNTPSFALPYWNWTNDRQIPVLFTTDPLNDTSRQVSPSTAMPSGYNDGTTMSSVMANSDFNAFASMQGSDQWDSQGAGALEGTPHNFLHWWIEGDMNTYLSPLDPLFWMHHCNIDRLWAVWNAQYANTADPAWLNYQLQYNDFPNWMVSSTLSTEAMGYTYDLLTSV
jgi:tyrosinase